MKNYYLFLILLLLFTSCKKENTDILMQYEQTGCSDAWGYGSGGNDDETKMKLANYLSVKGIVITDLKFEQLYFPEGCKACFCKTGKVFTFKTTSKYLSNLLKEGFAER